MQELPDDTSWYCIPASGLPQARKEARKEIGGLKGKRVGSQ
jgi:hypothetical protein